MPPPALLVAATALASWAADAVVARELLPRTVFQKQVHLPLAGADYADSFNLVLVSEEGHDVGTTATGICNNVHSTFNSTTYADACVGDMSAGTRAARGLILQHDARYAAAVGGLEERLGNDGYMSREFDVTLYSKPFRASFLRRLASNSQPPAAVCEVGFGAGHSALFWLSTLPATQVHSFDHGLHRYTIPAHEFLDDAYPDRLFLYLGDSVITVSHLPDYYADVRCDVVYLDGSPTSDTVSRDLAAFKPLVSKDHVVILASAPPGSEALAAWEASVAAGEIAWEGTLREGPATGDMMLYGHYAL